MTHCPSFTTPITMKQINPARTKRTPAAAMKEGYGTGRA